MDSNDIAGSQYAQGDIIIIIVITIFIRRTDPITNNKQFKARNYKQQCTYTKLHIYKDNHTCCKQNTNTHARAGVHAHRQTHTNLLQIAVLGEYG